MANGHLNLSNLTFLVAQAEPHYYQIFRSILNGFGAGTVLGADTTELAKSLLFTRKIDILICDKDLPKLGGIDLVRSIRSNPTHPCRAIPILISMGSSEISRVRQARDAGAHMVIRKPVSSEIVFDRLEWIANHPRAFWDSEDYYGPDRRFRPDNPDLKGGRRGDDVSEEQIDEIFSVPEEL